MDAKKSVTSKLLVPSSRPAVCTFSTNGISLPSQQVIAAIAENMAENEMFRHGIMPCTPRFDVGADRVTYYGHVLKRVQIKGQETRKSRPNCLIFDPRRKSGGVASGYKKHELDAFIFVHTELRLFYIVPACKISPQRTSITFGPNSHRQWLNAWWVLKQEQHHE